MQFSASHYIQIRKEFDMFLEGNVYTKGQSFRAKADANARYYRMNQLRIEDCDNWGHWLTVRDGNRGLNFLPLLRQTIL